MHAARKLYELQIDHYYYLSSHDFKTVLITSGTIILLLDFSETRSKTKQEMKSVIIYYCGNY